MSESTQIDQDASKSLHLRAGKAFQPRAPITTREFFAGRWEQMTTVADAVFQQGLHIAIFGERGVGKTSLASIISPLLYVMEKDIVGHEPAPRIVVQVNANSGDGFSDVWQRALDEIVWDEEKRTIGFEATHVKDRKTLREAWNLSGKPNIDEVRRVLCALPGSVFIFDEFDRAEPEAKREFTDLIKVLSDFRVETTIVVVGVSETVDQLVRDHASIVRSLVQVQLPRMDVKELEEILEKASKALDISFAPSAASLIVRMSQGLPHYTHLIGLHSTRQAARRLTRQIELQDVHSSFAFAVKQAIQSIRDKYLKAIHSAHKDALYDKVILACAIASSTAKDALGYFHPSDVVPPLSRILNRDNVKIATFQKHITEFSESARGPMLDRSGMPRAYKYRFVDPLQAPYVFMTAVSEGLISPHSLEELTSG